MIELNKKKKIKLPQKVSVVIDNQRQNLIIKGPLSKRFLKLKFLIILVKHKHSLFITDISTTKVYKKKEWLSKTQGFFIFKIKKLILETLLFYTKKLHFVGIGYKYFLVNQDLKLIQMNIGYSHNIFFKSPLDINIFAIKNTLLYLKSLDYDYLSKIVSLIKLCKKSNSYKKKGILTSNEINKKLKQTKKL